MTEANQKRLTMMIPAEIHKALKLAAVNEEISMTEIVLDAIKKRLSVKKGKTDE